MRSRHPHKSLEFFERNYELAGTLLEDLNLLAKPLDEDLLEEDIFIQTDNDDKIK